MATTSELLARLENHKPGDNILPLQFKVRIITLDDGTSFVSIDRTRELTHGIESSTMTLAEAHALLDALSDCLEGHELDLQAKQAREDAEREAEDSGRYHND